MALYEDIVEMVGEVRKHVMGTGHEVIETSDARALRIGWGCVECEGLDWECGITALKRVERGHPLWDLIREASGRERLTEELNARAGEQFFRGWGSGEEKPIPEIWDTSEEEAGEEEVRRRVEEARYEYEVRCRGRGPSRFERDLGDLGET